MATDCEVVYIALSTADPCDDALGMVEPVGNGYARVAHSDWWKTPARILQNDGRITFPVATGDWGLITHYAIYSELVDGKMLACGALVKPQTILAGNDCYIAGGAIRLAQSD